MRVIQTVLFLYLLLLAPGCAKVEPDAGVATDVLSPNDFKITPQEEKLGADLGGIIESSESDQKTLLKKLGFPLDGDILGKWEKYLEEVHHSSMEREETVARRVHGDYLKSIADHAARLSTCDANKIGVGPWLEDLKTRFGEAYVKDHAGDIGMVLFTLKTERNMACMEEPRKSLLQAEWKYQSLQKWHLRKLAEFSQSDELTAEEKERFKPALRTAKTYLSLMDKASVGELIFLRQDLDQGERLKSVPKDLTDFLVGHPAFSQPFALDLVVIDALRGE